jgi:hypothetical protein
MKHIGTRVGIDLAEFALAGDTLSPDPDLAVQDGWLKLAATHTVDAAGANIDDALLSRMYKAVPDKYLENDLGWSFYLQRVVAIDWRSSVSGRMTVGGDKALQEAGIPPFFGIPVKKDNTIKIDLTTGFTKGLFVHPQNLIVGIWKEVTIETWRDIKRRQLVVTVHLRAAFQIEQPDACSLLVNVARQWLRQARHRRRPTACKRRSCATWSTTRAISTRGSFGRLRAVRCIPRRKSLPCPIGRSHI